eukprot:9281499-Pyramimonas_sp.AAC.1
MGGGKRGNGAALDEEAARGVLRSPRFTFGNFFMFGYFRMRPAAPGGGGGEGGASCGPLGSLLVTSLC